MPQLQPPQKKKTVSDLAAGAIISITAALDGLKAFLLLADGFFVTIPISIVVSFVDSIMELLVDSLGLYISGAFKGKNLLNSLLIMLIMFVMGFIPVVNDAPTSTVGVILIIRNSRKNDKVEYEKAMKKYAEQVKNKPAQEDFWQQRRVIAVQNAEAQRKEAMRISREAVEA